MAKQLHSDIEKYVIEVVRNNRIELGWSQKDLALELDLSIGFIGDVESPKQRAKFNLSHINELAKVFNVLQKTFFLKYRSNVYCFGVISVTDLHFCL